MSLSRPIAAAAIGDGKTTAVRRQMLRPRPRLRTMPRRSPPGACNRFATCSVRFEPANRRQSTPTDRIASRHWYTNQPTVNSLEDKRRAIDGFEARSGDADTLIQRQVNKLLSFFGRTGISGSWEIESMDGSAGVGVIGMDDMRVLERASFM